MNTFPSTQHLDRLRDAQRSINNAIPLMDQAEACGIDCQEYRQGARAMSDQIGNFIARFFPDQSPHAPTPAGPGRNG